MNHKYFEYVFSSNDIPIYGFIPVSSSHLTPYGDLSSLFVGEENFSKFTAEMVRQIMKEEEYRAQHQVQEGRDIRQTHRQRQREALLELNLLVVMTEVINLFGFFFLLLGGLTEFARESIT